MIYIKDMDMPVDCLGCRISCKHESYMVPGRPEDCPLEEAKTGDLISRADAIEAVNRSSIYAWSTEQDLVAHSWAIRILQSLQSAEAVQGEWIFRTDIPIGGERESAGYVCSNCRKDYFHVDGMNFCPNCGAKMNKGGEE